MSDILIARLKEYANDNGYTHSDYADTMKEAAARIAELEAENAALRKIVDCAQVVIAASKTDPNAKKGWASERKWTTINLRTEEYARLMAALEAINKEKEE
jgi:hypothetical protein